MKLRPDYVFKYIPVNTDVRLDRIRKIIMENALFFPRPASFNDPMEAKSVDYWTATLGSGYYQEAGKMDPNIRNLLDEYRVLSISLIPNSTVMWAHYADEYRGCCLVLSTKGALSEVEPVIYSDVRFGFSAPSFSEELYDVIHESLLFKNTDWAYENEWRLISRVEEEYIKLQEGDLCGVIIGNNMNPSFKEYISQLCVENNLPCFRTYTMKGRNAINFIPIEMDGPIYTPFEIREYMKNKIRQSQFIGDELRLFDLLNNDISIDDLIYEIADDNQE